MKTRPRVLARSRLLASELADDNGGFLPNPNRLIEMGHGALYRYILRHPEQFEDFNYQEAVGVQNDATTFNVAIRQEHLKTAEGFIEQRGKLPTPKWLIANGFTKLASYMRIHPAVFSNLKGNGRGIMVHAAAVKSSVGRKRRKKRVHNC